MSFLYGGGGDGGVRMLYSRVHKHSLCSYDAIWISFPKVIFAVCSCSCSNDPQKLQKVNQNKRNAHERSKSLRCSEHLRTYTHIHTYTIKKNSFGKWNTQVIAIAFVLRTDEQTLRQLLLALYTLN